MKVKRLVLLFEQSGTFKNIAKGLGVAAYDYDIKNDFGETDFQLDLFTEIKHAYNDKPSIFDGFDADDLLIAFFPCVRFSPQSIMLLRQNNFGYEQRPLDERLDNSINYMKEVSYFYRLLCMLFVVAERRHLRLVVENPFAPTSFLCRYFPLRPFYIDYDRREHGDLYPKPTQYFKVGFEIPFDLDIKCPPQGDARITSVHGFKRSLISPIYAGWFLFDFLKVQKYE